MRFIRSLQFQFALGMSILLLLLICLIGLFYWQQKSVQQYSLIEQNITNSQEALAAINNRASNYKDNAPRDFESYSRDLSVSYKGFTRDMQLLSKGHKKLDSSFESLILLPQLVSQMEKLSVTYQSLQKQLFNHYQENIGPNPKQPRLEWAAEGLMKDAPELESALNNLMNSIKGANAEQLIILDSAIVGLSVALIVALLFASIWFYARVIRRTQYIAKACDGISQGEFGIQIAQNWQDELGLLADSFNLMSSRTHMVSKLTNELQKSANMQEALQIFMSASKPYLGINWTAMIALDHHSQRARISADSSYIHNVNSDIDLNANDFGRSMLKHIKNNKVMSIHDVNRYRLKNGNSRFLRDLHRTTLAKHVYVFPLCINSIPHGAVMIAHPAHEISMDQIKLLEHIIQLMASHLVSLLSSGQGAFIADSLLSESA